jgi:hypothetical protein
MASSIAMLIYALWVFSGISRHVFIFDGSFPVKFYGLA